MPGAVLTSQLRLATGLPTLSESGKRTRSIRQCEYLRHVRYEILSTGLKRPNPGLVLLEYLLRYHVQQQCGKYKRRSRQDGYNACRIRFRTPPSVPVVFFGVQNPTSNSFCELTKSGANTPAGMSILEGWIYAPNARQGMPSLQFIVH